MRTNLNIFWKEYHMNNKTVLTVISLFFLVHLQLFPDSFTDAIQDLAVRTACVGQYSATEAGGGWYEDPHDYYTPKMMAARLARESGNMTRTETFYGVCFDYAQFAWNYVNQNKKWYKAQGLYEGQFWICGVDDNSKELTLCYPGNARNYSFVQNGVYVKVPAAGGLRYVQSHDGATHHAWLWLERSDGVLFWIDPTWTDNVGYPVFGYISKKGKEIQCRPNREYCVNHPSSLDTLPLPPSYKDAIPPSSTANSTNREETIKDAGRTYVDVITGKVTHASGEDMHIIYSLGYHTPCESPFSSSAMGFSLSVESVPVTADTFRSGIFMLQMDYYALSGSSALLFDLNVGYQITPNYYGAGIYVGGGIGWTTDNYIPLSFSNPNFAWKLQTGVRVMLRRISLRAEFSYFNKSDCMMGLYIGLPIFNKNSRH